MPAVVKIDFLLPILSIGHFVFSLFFSSFILQEQTFKSFWVDAYRVVWTRVKQRPNMHGHSRYGQP